MSGNLSRNAAESSSGKPPDSVFDDHFRNPRRTGVLDDADGRLEVENPVCGDLLVLTWKATGGRIDDARFQVYGCPAAIAAGSAMIERVCGASAAELAGLGPDDIAGAIGGLEASHFHAAVLAADAVRALVERLERLDQ